MLFVINALVRVKLYADFLAQNSKHVEYYSFVFSNLEEMNTSYQHTTTIPSFSAELRYVRC